MTGLLGTAYSMNQASYDLSRLARNGLIARGSSPASRTATSTPSPAAGLPALRALPGGPQHGNLASGRRCRRVTGVPSMP